MDSTEPFLAQVRTFYFPGWWATIDGTRAVIVPTDPQGLIALSIPAGLHHVVIGFGCTPVREVAAALSIGSLIGLAGLLASSSRRRASIAEVKPLHVYSYPLKITISKEEQP